VRSLVGPIFVPGETGCWKCLSARLMRNREVETYIVSRTKLRMRHARAMTSASLETTFALAALEVQKFFSGARNVAGRIIEFDAVGSETRIHPLRRRPQCPSCGTVTNPQSPLPIFIRTDGCVVDRMGGVRTTTPDETYETWKHLVSPLTGVVTTVVEAADSSGVLFNAMSGHNFAMDVSSLESLRKGLRSKSAGKGINKAQARAGALCEAVERYSGLFTGEEFRQSSSLVALGDAGIHPNRCMLYSERQYHRREEINALGEAFNVVPKRFDPQAVLEWSPAWSLTERRQKWLPTGYLYFAYPRRKKQFFVWADSNGCAAGNTLEEAILQGALELVERDAVAIWWYNKVRRPRVDLAAFGNPYFDRLVRHYSKLNRDIWAIDLTSDIGIPVFATVSRRTDKEVEDIVFAFGAHLDPEIAIMRSVSEVNQFIPAVLPIKSDGSGEYAYDDPASRKWWMTARLAQHDYLVPDDNLPTVTRRESAVACEGSIGDMVEGCRRIFESRGLEMLVLDQTRPDIGLPVARVMVPGMRHFWSRLAPGRLYDVPVDLGWCKSPTPEDRLNEVAMFV
jgi:ribosomal protein S12 methylthiotransferase accessory factor